VRQKLGVIGLEPNHKKRSFQIGELSIDTIAAAKREKRKHSTYTNFYSAQENNINK